MNDARQSLIDQLEREVRDNGSFIRVHAAEVLCEYGFGFKVAALFQADVDTATPNYRLGVWRVLARIAANEAERQRYVERIRRVMLDPAAPDRIGAAESLAKLKVADRADRAPLEQWLATADDEAAPFALWLLLHSSTPAERPSDEARLARFLDSPAPIARLRAAYALGRLGTVSPDSASRLGRRAAIEPADSPARVYLLAAALLHPPDASAPVNVLKTELRHYLEAGKANEQFEAAIALGLTGSTQERPALEAALKSREGDARIGAAGALLRMLR